MKSKRQIAQARRRKKKMTTILGWGGAALAVILLLAYALFVASRPQPAVASEAVPVMSDVRHVPDGTDPGPYNTDPPTSGRHYAESLRAGFYEEGDVPGEYPQGLLVHSLEHGYVIFWYNCTLLDEQACADLKDQIRGVMDEENNFKVIAYPWESTEAPVVMTSWGRMLRFEEFDPAEARSFVRSNRNKAPEPNAP